MEQKKDYTWNERHPNGNLRYYTFIDEFDGIGTLDEIGTKCILRTLKYHLESEIGFEISDEAFLAIFFKIINLGPARPLGMYSFFYGFAVPMKKLLQELNLHCGVQDIFRFFNVRNPDNRHYRKLLLHVPHSSLVFPQGTNYSFDDLDEEERLLIDYYTGELFIPEHHHDKINSAFFDYCRLYCDVERLVNDPLEERGLGISYGRWVPSRSGHGETYRSFSTKSSAFKLYADYHASVAKMITEMIVTPLLIDCHSFSSRPNLLNSNPPNIDICIGYNDDATCPDKVVIGNIVQHFKSLGYKVGINEPFSNSKTFEVPVEYHSVMIEVNKRLYMDEQTLEKTDGFDQLKADIQSLYEKLLQRSK